MSNWRALWQIWCVAFHGNTLLKAEVPLVITPVCVSPRVKRDRRAHEDKIMSALFKGLNNEDDLQAVPVLAEEHTYNHNGVRVALDGFGFYYNQFSKSIRCIFELV